MIKARVFEHFILLVFNNCYNKDHGLVIEYSQILENEGLEDWKIRWNTGGGLCFYEKKEIWMGNDKADISLFLHEVAHAKCPKEICGICWTDVTGHNAIWGDEFTNLIRKYMICNSKP